MKYDAWICSLPAAEQKRLSDQWHEQDRSLLAKYERLTTEAQREVRNAQRRGRSRKLDDAQRRLATMSVARDAIAELVAAQDPANWPEDA